MSRPVRKRRLSLAKEFRNSVKAGPRVWLIVAAVFLCLVVLPLLSKLATLLALVLVGAGLFFIAPVIISAVVRGLVGQFKQSVTFRVFTNVAGTGPVMKPAGEMLSTPVIASRGKSRPAEVIEVETVPDERSR